MNVTFDDVRLAIDVLEAADRPPHAVGHITDEYGDEPIEVLHISATRSLGAGSPPGLNVSRASYSAPVDVALRRSRDKRPRLVVGVNRSITLCEIDPIDIIRTLETPTPFLRFFCVGDGLFVLHEAGVGRVDVDRASWAWTWSLDVVTDLAIRGTSLLVDTMDGAYLVDLETGKHSAATT